jgi:hypothetical protein
MSDSPRSAALDAQLADLTREAEARRQAATAPSEADLALVTHSARLVEVLLTDIHEALRQVCVAGLSFPDPELPEALRELADRARLFQLATAVELLGKLRAWLLAVLAEPSIEARQSLAAGAWTETQRLMAWSRLFKAEHDLLTVQSRLAAEATGIQRPTTEEFQTRSLTLWPLGIELSASGKLLVFGIDIERLRSVVLADHLAEFQRESPFEGKAISRMFQDAIELPQLLSSLIRLEDHPVVDKGPVQFFRPAFRTIPKRLGVASHFTPPRLPEFTISEWVGLPTGPAFVKGALGRGKGRVFVVAGKGELPLSASGLLRFNLSKLLLREGARSTSISLVVLPRDETFDVLSAETPIDDRVFPAHDPLAFRVAREVLQARADRAQIAGEPVAQSFLRVAAYTLGHGKPDAIERLKQQVRTLSPVGIEEHYRTALALSFLGLQLPPYQVEATITEALGLLVLPAGHAVPVPALARVLGRAEQDVSPSDVRLVDGAVAYRAIWLAMQAGLVDDLRPLLVALFTSRYQGELKSPSVGDVCSRALLVVLLGSHEGLATAAVSDGLDEDEDDDEDDDGDTKTADGRSEQKVAEALVFLQSHLDDLAPKRATTRTAPLPESIELLQLGDTRAYLRGENRLGVTLAGLNLPAERLRQGAVEALSEWVIDAGDQPGWPVAAAAADALLVAAAADQIRFIVS